MPRQAADRLAIDFGDAGNFALALSGGQQGEDYSGPWKSDSGLSCAPS